MTLIKDRYLNFTTNNKWFTNTFNSGENTELQVILADGGDGMAAYIDNVHVSKKCNVCVNIGNNGKYNDYIPKYAATGESITFSSQVKFDSNGQFVDGIKDCMVNTSVDNTVAPKTEYFDETGSEFSAFTDVSH